MSDMEGKETTVNGFDESPEDNDVEMIEKDQSELAEGKKEQGNNFYKQQKYTEALDCYTEAINLCPTCASYHGNRAATYMMMKRYKDALRDAQESLQLDNTFIKGYIREGKCHLMLGNALAAMKSYNHVLELDGKNATAIAEMKNVKSLQDMEGKVEMNFARNDHRTAMYCLDRCLDQSPACQRFRVLKAEALTYLGRHQEAQELANEVLQREGMNADAVFVRGLSLYYQDSTEKAFQHFQQVLRLAPDHSKAREALKRAKQLTQQKEAGNGAFRAGKLQDAYDLYTKALEVDPLNKSTNSKLFCNRATVSSKLNKLEDAIADCTKALDLDNGYIKAYLRRAKCYSETEQYEDAVRDYEKVFKLQKTRENKQLLQQAKIDLKRSQRKDYYKILGVKKGASEDEIKKAYKKRAMVHHPDRHANAAKEEQKEEEKKFKECGEAYSVLSDTKKRQRYDNGQDLEDMHEGGGHGFGDVDPNQIFQAFFGGGMGGGMPGGFSFGGGHGGGGAQGFPGGGCNFQFG